MDSPEPTPAGGTRARHPSIFNDVIGPIMRGPSSSHCAAANRIGILARQLAAGRMKKVSVRFDVAGALATTHASQGSDMGLFGGLLGWDVRDERIVDSARAISESGIDVDISIGDFGHSHPSTYHLVLESEGERHEIVAISTGGGMIEVVEIDGCPLSFAGDRYAIVVWGTAPEDVLRSASTALQDARVCGAANDGSNHEQPSLTLFTLYREPEPHVGSTLASVPGVTRVRTLSPVLPILSPDHVSAPFSSSAEMASFNESRGLTLADLAVTYECERSGEPKDAVIGRMIDIVKLLRASIAAGLSGTDYDDRILGPQAAGYARAGEEGRLVDLGALNRVIAYVTALMEVKSSMGLIVAAPTAGACAAFPGTCLGLGDEMGADDGEVARAMFAGGMIGAFIARGSTFSAELAGCQAEGGSASGMAAAAIVQMQGGTAAQCEAAASMALQNTLGMICDPVADRVEVPCLGKNVMAAANALSCANMALAGFDPVIPLDEVIGTLDTVGRSLPRELRCTALGGLSRTPTSLRIRQRLNRAGGLR